MKDPYSDFYVRERDGGFIRFTVRPTIDIDGHIGTIIKVAKVINV